jgi:hypothetical protein
MKAPPDPNYHHRFLAEVISHAGWLYAQNFDGFATIA